jgi:hypothetical protein
MRTILLKYPIYNSVDPSILSWCATSPTKILMLNQMSQHCVLTSSCWIQLLLLPLERTSSLHRTFNMNVWCFVIAHLVAIIGWLKIWLAGAFYQGYQPDLVIFQGDLYSWYEKIWLENISRVFKVSITSIKRDLENLIVHTTKTKPQIM